MPWSWCDGCRTDWHFDFTGTHDAANGTFEIDSFGYFDELETDIARLLELPAPDINVFLGSLFPAPDEEGHARTRAVNKREKVKETFHQSTALANVRHTAFGVWQAVSEWEQHDGTMRGTDDRAGWQAMKAIEGGFTATTKAAGLLLSGVGIG